MIRDTTFNDITRGEVLDNASADFVMDEATFRTFYDRSASRLWGYLARITGDRQLADDLLQETFYRFLRAAATYENETHRRNTLYRIATNLVRDERRRSRIRVPVDLAGEGIEGIASPTDAAAPDRNADFTRAMSLLKPRERAMLWLAYAEGSSHREIANVLGLEPASLKTLLSRARRKLADLLGGAKR